MQQRRPTHAALPLADMARLQRYLRKRPVEEVEDFLQAINAATPVAVPTGGGADPKVAADLGTALQMLAAYPPEDGGKRKRLNELLEAHGLDKLPEPEAKSFREKPTE